MRNQVAAATRSTSSLALAIAVAVAAWPASPARGQPGAGATTAATAAPEPVPTDQIGRLDDANIDRGWFMSTAMTQPAGSVSFNAYEIIFLGVTYAPIDRLQITATALTPVTSDMCCWGIFGVKLRALDAGRFHFAVAGSALLASVQNINLYGEGASSQRSMMWAALVTGSASVCLDEACRSLVSAFATSGFNQYSDTSEWPILYGASLTWGHHVKLLLEADSAALLGDVTKAARGALITYGVRFSGPNFAGDVGFTRPFGEGVDVGSLVMGFPVLTFTYRAL